MTAAPATRRRWFRFSLRTFLLAFTLVAVWLGWNARIVHQRKRFIADLPAESYVRTRRPKSTASGMKANYERAAAAVEQADTEMGVANLFQSRPGKPETHSSKFGPTAGSELSWLRRQLGDQPYATIAYFPGPTAQSACDLFPEATVIVADERAPNAQSP